MIYSLSTNTVSCKQFCNSDCFSAVMCGNVAQRVNSLCFIQCSIKSYSISLFLVRIQSISDTNSAPLWLSLRLTDSVSRYICGSTWTVSSEPRFTPLASRLNDREWRCVPRLRSAEETIHTWGPILQNILRRSYDYLTITPQLRSTYDGRLIYKTACNEWKAFS